VADRSKANELRCSKYYYRS